MRIVIMGAGALGSVIGGFLSKNNNVTLIGRLPHVNKIKKDGLKISGIWGEHVFYPEVCTSPKEVKEIPELIIITTKAYDTAKALSQLECIISEENYVMSMQNGIGNEEIIASYVGKERTLGGMAIFGAIMVAPGHSKVTVYASECLVGSLVKDMEIAKRIAKILDNAGIPTKATDDIIRDKWMKAFYNIALNPLSAILDKEYGFLGKHENAKKIIKHLLREAFEVAKAEGVNLKYDWQGYYNYLINKQLPPTAKHISSMLQDLKRGKKTEIDYLNGMIVKLGKKHGIATKANEIITNIIKLMEVK